MTNTLNFYDEPLKGRIISSGITMPVKKILEDGRVLLDGMGEPLGPDEVELIDNIDYDQYRPQFAGKAMQAILNACCINTQLLEQMHKRAYREGFKTMGQCIAQDAVSYADDLILALKKPRKLNPLDFRSKVNKEEE